MPLSKIQTNSIAASNITPALISSLVGLALANTQITGTMTASQIGDAAITTAKIAAGAINSSKVNNELFKLNQGQFPNNNGDNLNDWLTPGGYNFVTGSYNSFSNHPPIYGYGTLLVFNVGSFTTQMAFPHYDQGGYYRTKYNAGTNNDYWISWKAFT